MPHHDEHTQGSTQLTGKKHDIVTKYLADQLAVEGHIYQAIDKQVKETQDEPDINPFLTDARDTLEQHVNALRARLESLGGQSTSPVKEAGASILGVAAGVIDKLRPNACESPCSFLTGADTHQRSGFTSTRPRVWRDADARWQSCC